MDNEDLIQLLNKGLAIELAEKMPYTELHSLLSVYINQLIKNDFSKLINYLYQIDVSEQKLKNLLEQSPQQDADNIIATLIIERLQQKIKTRNQFNPQQDNDINEEEKW